VLFQGLGPFLTDVIALCKVLETESAKPSNMRKEKHVAWSSKLTLAATLLKHAVRCVCFVLNFLFPNTIRQRIGAASNLYDVGIVSAESCAIGL
jgi:hypothetical protein